MLKSWMSGLMTSLTSSLSGLTLTAEEREMLQQTIVAALQVQGPVECQYRIVRADGEVRHIHSRAETRRDATGKPAGVFGMSRDLTERHQAEEALRQSEEQLRPLTDGVPVLIRYIDASLRYRLVNRAHERWLSRPMERLIGEKVDSGMSESNYGKLLPMPQRALEGERTEFETSLLCPDGKQRLVHALCIPDHAPEGTVRGLAPWRRTSPSATRPRSTCASRRR